MISHDKVLLLRHTGMGVLCLERDKARGGKQEERRSLWFILDLRRCV